MENQPMGSPPSHPEEMRAELELRLGPAGTLRATARATPAGLVAAGVLIAAILLSAAALLRARR
ncbi:hypothetical protein EAH89_02930 [Roseomonas nepalensis]|uniref:Uncharacterized protein n=1 Tax=Muricoccus nepalensis TaxID=1854500 RepID=A0A502GFH3_9PROT|nr:hypothetical protein [Roseomonas nepalensis]TPG60352.1 hypothetical protein EAH89_02930 [Roseomonas nepalensis]